MWFVLNQLNTYFGTSMMIMILCVFVHYLFTIGALARQAWLLRLTHHFRVYNQRHSPGGGGELRHAGWGCLRVFRCSQCPGSFTDKCSEFSGQ